ncbi:MAG TPA: sigma-70 family RNA polymerase sigma factor [Candidatus Fournierella merdigallinarum]|nr:sigma-70 family RNA polymerase sigma factor [Candidatus Fournierella merdigallinarum]
MNGVADKVLTAEQALEYYGPLVLRTAFGLVKNMQDAEDISQEVFLTLLKKDPAFESPAHQQAWLLRCAINRCKSHFRSAWQRRTDALDEGLSVPFTPAESEVMKAVGDLPMKYRQVIYLHYIQGYSTGEIAKLLDLNQNTVLSQLARGRALLKNTLKGEF